jgi:hypothetical protein
MKTERLACFLNAKLDAKIHDPSYGNFAEHSQVLEASPAPNIDPGADLRVDLNKILILGTSTLVEHDQMLKGSLVLNVD